MSLDAVCPSPELLRRSLDPNDSIAADERRRIEAHVDGCQRGCKAAILSLLRGRTNSLGPDGPPTVDRSDSLASNASAAPAQPNLPGYEILGELGRDGMGVVYRARQVALGRIVALKVLHCGLQARPEELLRFQVEAEAVAQLQHPNIVQIFEVGQQDGLAYFVLEYAPGGSLAQKLRAGPLPGGEAARLAETLARAVQHAHEHGILHRDLKPANILLNADGTPKVADFGLACRLQGDHHMTRSGAILGTPSYMAPEQASGATRQQTTAVDVYALGAVLYELLTGRPPFRAATPLETVLRVRNEEPVLPRRLQAGVPRDLETICLKCLAKEPAQRYESAQAVAEDLRRFQAGQPIRARPVAWPERLVKWVKRRPAVAALSAAVVVVVLGSLAGLTTLYFNAERQRRLAERQEAGAWAITRFFEDNVLAAARPKRMEGGPATTSRCRRRLTTRRRRSTRPLPASPSVRPRFATRSA